MTKETKNVAGDTYGRNNPSFCRLRNVRRARHIDRPCSIRRPMVAKPGDSPADAADTDVRPAANCSQPLPIHE